MGSFNSVVNDKISRIRCVMLISLFLYKIIERSSNETKSQESCISNQDTPVNNKF